jgi:hypothetical protein
MVHEGWIHKPYVRWWLEENPSVKRWLTETVTKPNTQYDYGYNLMRFCEGIGESPERLREIRLCTDGKVLGTFRSTHQIPNQGPPDKGGQYVILDLLQKFIRAGKLVDLSAHNLGATIEVSQLSKTKRAGLYNAVRAYFKTIRAPLPEETFKITENSRVVPRNKEFTMEGRKGVEEAKQIILASKEPYKTLFWAALYGGFGDAELCTLNGQWPEIRRQLQAGKDPVRVEFLYRKSNEQKYYTFVPARIFQPYVQHSSIPFLTVGMKGEKGRGPVNENNLVDRWRGGRARARIESEVGVHNIRDLWRTCAVKAGVDSSVAEFFVGHSIDPNRYNQIYKDVPFMVHEWEKMRKFIDGETQEWRKDVDELKQRLEKNDYDRKEEVRRTNREFLIALQLSRGEIKRIEKRVGGDLANLTKQEKAKLAEKAKKRFQQRGELKESKPPPRLRATAEEAELLQEQGWEKIEEFQSGRVLLEWRYSSPPPKRPILAPST